MRSVFIAALLASTTPGLAYAGPSAARGVVESVREVQLAERSSFPGVLELAFKPPVADELLVRLDDGQVIRVVHTGTRIFQPGERVHVVADPGGARLERADDHTFLQP